MNIGPAFTLATFQHMLRTASYVVVVVKVYVGAYLIVTNISYLQVNSLLLFTSHDTIACIYHIQLPFKS